MDRFAVCHHGRSERAIAVFNSIREARIFCQKGDAPTQPLVIWHERFDRLGAYSTGIAERWWGNVCIEDAWQDRREAVDVNIISQTRVTA